MICGEPIKSGTAYMRWVEKVEGKNQTRKAHLGCEAVSLLAPVADRGLEGIMRVIAEMTWEEVRSEILQVEKDEMFRVEVLWKEACALHKLAETLEEDLGVLTEQAVHDGTCEPPELEHIKKRAQHVLEGAFKDQDVVDTAWRRLGRKIRNLFGS